MDKLEEDIKYAHDSWRSYTSVRSSVNQQVELETRLGVTPKETGTKELYWNNAYYKVRDQAIRKTSSKYVNKIVNDGIISYRQRDLDGKPVWQMKMKKVTYNHYNLWMKVSVSIESPTHGPPNIPNVDVGSEEDVTTRNVSRHSFYIGNSSRVDFSKVYTKKGRSQFGPPTFEVEVEYIHGKLSSFKDYYNTIIMVHKAMFQTDLVFTYDSLVLASGEANAMLSTGYPSSLVAQRHNYLDRSYFSEAKALDIKDLTLKNMFPGGSSYSISLKTDGDRTFFIITRHGCFGLYPPSRAAMYSDNDYTRTSGLTVIDAEYYNGDLYFIDALFIEGDDLRKLQDYQGRRRAYNTWITKIRDDNIDLGITFREKQSVPLEVGGFFGQIHDMLDERNVVDFISDGLMFTPNSLSYIDTTLDNLAILKWKPEITIDFRYKSDKLWCSDDATHEDVLFEGSDKVAFKGEIVIGNVVATPGSIIEFKLEGDNLVAIKNRPEKLGPNKQSTAFDNWNKLNIDPVTEDTLACGNNALMRKYHGRIKNDLFIKGKGGVLLDIGSGRGGDLNKWLNGGYTTIIAVEPSDKNIEELRDRLKEYKEDFQKRVHILQATGQDSRMIRKFVTKHKIDKVDVVSMMDSLTFFFDNDKSLTKLNETIRQCLKPNGLFIWKAMNGSLVKNAFKTHDQTEFYYGNKGQDYIKMNGYNELYVNISPNVGGIEWYTDLDKLKLVLGMEGDVTNATHELLLDEKYNALSSLYSYGVFKFKNTVKIPDAVVRVLFRGKLIPNDFKYINSNSVYNSCIEAVESLFTNTSHHDLMTYYAKESFSEDKTIESSEDGLPPYTKFETAWYGFFVKSFFKNFPITESEVLESSDPKDINCSLAFADLLGIDVFVTTDKGEIYTNSIVGSINPCVAVIKTKSSYRIDDRSLFPGTFKEDSDRVEFPNLSRMFAKAFPMNFELASYIDLATPILYRCSYNTKIAQPDRLKCLANHILETEDFTIGKRIMEEYGFKGSYSTVKTSLLELIDALQSEED
jgi:SAM-dependent methyltransferase